MKHKRNDDVEPSGPSGPSPLKKRVVKYKCRWFTANVSPNGANRFYDRAMAAEDGDGPNIEQFKLDGTRVEVWYFCEACDA